ncbi:hypothetical protein CYMTET_29406 [Cymbomonas tetramitiformis]|uniref:Uncharacterized protein n=1 Tax=Cymbomonas tetramitiformis TaxID=36881 RepID=A0AAE0FL25_9CHLO|nr:hypothetical protein CYMTET_29406 [Cymbomonas tetramitiformis]
MKQQAEPPDDDEEKDDEEEMDDYYYIMLLHLPLRISGQRTEVAGSDTDTPDALVYYGMEVGVQDGRIFLRQMMQNEKRDSVQLSDERRAFPFVHWSSACQESRKASTLVSAMCRMLAHTDAEWMTVALLQL